MEDVLYEACHLEGEGGTPGEEVRQGCYQLGPGSEVIIGLDVVGLYPSISKSLAMEVCKEAARATAIKIPT